MALVSPHWEPPCIFVVLRGLGVESCERTATRGRWLISPEAPVHLTQGQPVEILLIFDANFGECVGSVLRRDVLQRNYIDLQP
jgi:hypothetical protein